MKALTLTIDQSMDGRSVESLLRRELRISGTLMRRLKRREGGITLNGQRIFTTARVRAGDVLCADVSDDPALRPAPRKADFVILYEDEDIIVIDKPAGMASHASTREPDMPSAEGALAYYLPADVVPHPVSRLDRGTSGAMTFAKSGYIHELLREQFGTEDFYKEYLGICVGTPDPPCGSIDAPTGFAEGSRYKRAGRPDGVPSFTEYETLETRNGLSLVRLVPHTGRMHQLRVHMAYIGCPLVGDWLYGEENKALIARPALHAGLVRFRQPMTGEVVEVRAEWPEDMERVWGKAADLSGQQQGMVQLV